jgi:hypothetical protein
MLPADAARLGTFLFSLVGDIDLAQLESLTAGSRRST